jgi:DNA-binding transcriptional MerR regulator
MYTIKNVSMITGIGVHTLRAWEKRYSVVKPERSSSGRRYYSDEDIEKLKLIATLNKTGEQISQIAKLSFEDLKTRVGNLSEKDLYPEEEDKLATSLFILKQAFNLQVQDVLFHEFENMNDELKNKSYRFKSLINKLIVPFYEHVISQDEANPTLRPFCRTIYSLVAANLKTVLAQVIDDFQADKRAEGEANQPILVGSSGTVKGEIDSLIVCIKSYLSGKEALYIGPLVDKDVISEFIDNMDSKKVVITDRYVSFRPHPRLFDLMKELPSEKLQEVEFAVLLHRLNEMQRLEFENSDKVEVLKNFDSMDHYFAS